MDNQVLNAGKERSWSWVRLEGRWTGIDGVELGRLKVDIVALKGFVKWRFSGVRW